MGLEGTAIMTKKNPTSMRLSPEADERITTLAERLGISRASVIEMSVRVLQQFFDTLRDATRTRRVFTGDEEFMHALGMVDEDIAWVLAQPVEPTSDETYDRLPDAHL
jgi:predicted DNA-binding protein